ncbi:hypothetical protein A2U01_0041863, partial [Trifolium medium]|nr:hypothetical protein [Trifolium medium]
VDSVRGFKERYYVVRPRTPSGRDSLYSSTIVTEDDGSARLDEDGRPVVRRIARFPLSWSEEHFATSTDSYLTKDEALSDGERVRLAKLQSFVEKFEPARYVTRAGTPTLDSRGRPRVEARYINTKSLLECKGRAECKLLLDNMADFADELLKIAAEQKGPKRGKKVMKSRT